MDASSCSLWQCSTCTYAKNEWVVVECEMCSAIIHGAKRPASPVPASIAVDSKPGKQSRKFDAGKKKPPPQDPPPPVHSSGVVIDIVGTIKNDCGCYCEEHPDGCSAAVIVDDIVVYIQKEQILIEDFLLGKVKMREQTALTFNWVSDSIDRCHVGFLPKAYVQHAKLWDGALLQVVFVGALDDLSSIIHRKYHHYCGYAWAAVISALPRGVQVFDDKFKVMMG